MPDPTPPSADADLLATIEAAFERTLRLIAATAESVRFGSSLRTPELPLVWTLNQLRVTAPVGIDELLDVVEECQSDLPYRHVVVRHPVAIVQLEASLGERGWRIEHDVVMALTGRAARDEPDARVVALSEDQMLELMATWLCEERFEVSEDGLAQVLEYNRREGRCFDELRLGVLDADATPLSVTKLRTDGGFGWVEDVYTLPAARRRGHARTLVGHAVDLALDEGCGVVAIVADADDWPQHLYARVGFRPVGRASILHKDDAVG